MSTPHPHCPFCGMALANLVIPEGTAVSCPGCHKDLSSNENAGPSQLWYVAGPDQRVRGPFTWTQLTDLARRGRVIATDLIWRQGTMEWLPAQQCEGLWRQPIAAVGGVVAYDEDDALSSSAPAEHQGPLSMRGIKVRPLRTVTLGDLQIQKKLGAGAMGAVYLARQRGQDRHVALKVLARHLALRPGFIQRFYREATVMSRLEHPNIVRLFGVGETSGLHYLAMEYIDGFTMSALQVRRGGRLLVGDALHVVLTCARALHYAHMRQIVHRDIKPTNILVNQLGHIKLTDLGLAKPLDEEEDLSLTDSGVGIGTPQYMAPEQALSAKSADHRADIYSLGCVLYQLITNRLPFEEESAVKLLRAKEAGQFPPARRLNPEVTERLDLILDKMIAKEIRYRYQTYAELIDHLEKLGTAHEHFSFNPLHLDPGAIAPVRGEQMEVLLVEDAAEDILLAQEVLEERSFSSNLNVVRDVAEARAFLFRTEGYSWAPQPDLIILGRHLERTGGPELVAAIRADARLANLPMVILAAPGRAREAVAAHAADFELSLKKAGNFRQLRDLLSQPASGSTVAVVELPGGPFVGK